MRKLFAILLVIALMIPTSLVASAAETKLTTTVPPAEYTLTIPEDTVVPFGQVSTKLEPMVSVTNTSSFAVGKNLLVTLEYDAFKSDEASTTIPFTVIPTSISNSEIKSLIFKGQEDGTLKDYAYNGILGITSLYVSISSEDWGKALAGEYSATITFTAEVVVEE